MKWIGTGNVGMLLLAIWLIVHGVIYFVSIPFAQMAAVMAGMAIAAGVCLLLGR
jgi:hypothetical protein